MRSKENLFVLHIIYIHAYFIRHTSYIFTRGYDTRKKITSGVHSVKLSFNLTCKTNILYKHLPASGIMVIQVSYKNERSDKCSK
jgi:hypothetical protein